VSSIVWRIEHFTEIDSTNTWAVAEARHGAPEGLVAYADFQSEGRGRLDRTWESPVGASLLCSVLLRPDVPVEDLTLVLGAVALAARAALVRLSGVRPSLKWPNDLVVGDAKVAGLLAELVHEGDANAVVVGIGVNLTHEGPANVVATSVREQTGVTITPAALLDILLEELEVRRAQLDTPEGRAALRDEYRGSLATIGRRVRVERFDDIVSGEALGVDESLRLVLDVDGVQVVLSAGDVVHVRSHEGDQ